MRRAAQRGLDRRRSDIVSVARLYAWNDANATRRQREALMRGQRLEFTLVDSLAPVVFVNSVKLPSATGACCDHERRVTVNLAGRRGCPDD